MEPIILDAAELVRCKVKELVSTLSQFNFNHETLQGACGIASRTLHRVLKRLGIQNDFVVGRYELHDGSNRINHCWVEIPRLNVVVDLTATQFDLEDQVYFSPCCYPYIPCHRDAGATKHLSTWEGQSHIWYEKSLKEIEDFAVLQLRCYRKTKNEQLPI